MDVDRSLIMGLVPPGGSLIVLWRESGYSSGPIPESVVNMKYREFGKDENITTAEVKLVQSNRVICGPIAFGLKIINGQLEVKRL